MLIALCNPFGKGLSHFMFGVGYDKYIHTSPGGMLFCYNRSLPTSLPFCKISTSSGPCSAFVKNCLGKVLPGFFSSSRLKVSILFFERVLMALKIAHSPLSSPPPLLIWLESVYWFRNCCLYSSSVMCFVYSQIVCWRAQS